MSSLILITPPGVHPQEHELLRGMFERGLPRLHCRKPGFTGEQLVSYIEAIPKQFRGRIVMHQNHELVATFRLGGVHYREADIPDGLISAPAGTATSSLSYHNPTQLLTCKGEVDYCFLSPIYPSISKQGYEPPPALQDRESLADYLAGSRYPVIALGGVAPSSFEELAGLGFAGAALLGAIWDAPDPIEACTVAVAAAQSVAWNDVGGLSCNVTPM